MEFDEMEFDENGFDATGSPEKDDGFVGEWHELHVAAENGDVKAIQVELEKGSNVDVESRTSKKTPLQIAIGHERLDAATFLLLKGANVNKQDRDENTALIIAAFFGKENAVKLLLEAKADPTIKDVFTKTAVDWAKYRGHDTIAKLIEDFQNIQAAPAAPPAPNPFLSFGLTLKSAT